MSSNNKDNNKSYKITIDAIFIAIAVASRIFILTPQVKPFTAILIFSAIYCGRRAGFLIGVFSALISSFFLGLHPIVILQMICFGLIAYLSGWLFHERNINYKVVLISLYGFVSVMCFYAPIVNYASACIALGELVSLEKSLAFFFLALPMDLLHAISTVMFLFVICSVKSLYEKKFLLD